MESYASIQARMWRVRTDRARIVAVDIVRRKARRQSSPIRFHQGGPGFAIKHLDAETRALIDAALLVQPRAGRRAPA